jgi:hypothetical protein
VALARLPTCAEVSTECFGTEDLTTAVGLSASQAAFAAEQTWLKSVMVLN